MNVDELLAELSRQGATLWAEGERLKYRAPKGALSPETLSLMATHKAALLQHLRRLAAEGEAVHPLSHGQQALWFVHQMAPDSAVYNTEFSVRIVSPLDIAALKRACQALVDRHSVLRTTFATHQGQPIQKVHPQGKVHFEQVDASGSRLDDLRAQVTQAYAAPFDLERGPLMRVHLFSLAPRDHVLLITIHHIVYDGWSLMLLCDELLRRLYPAEKAGVLADLPPPRADYVDYVRWQAEMLAGPEGQRLWAYWSRQLSGPLPVLNLPFARPRPAVQRYCGASTQVTLSGSVTRQLKGLSEREGATLYTTLLAAFMLLLHRYTAQEDILVGSPALGRTQPQFARIVGNFINMIPLRGRLSDNPSFRSFLGQMRQTVVGALAHQDFPFQLLVERLNPERHPGHSPIFQAVFMLQPTPQESLFRGDEAEPQLPGGLLLRPFDIAQQEGQFDLALELTDSDSTLRGVLKYSTDLLDAAIADRIVGHLETLLSGIVEDPDRRLSDLPILTPAERRQALETGNEISAEVAGTACIHEMFEAQVRKAPDAIAVIFGDRQWTYRELNARGNRLAHHLRALGVGPEVRVGLCVRRGLDMVIGMLGILKAGGAYVPMDPTYPADRLAFMLTDSQATVVLTQTQLRSILPDTATSVVCIDTWDDSAPGEVDELKSGARAEHIAYTLYTSGSTGRPKGVMVCHRNVASFFAAMDGSLDSDSRTQGVWLATTSMSFDISVLEILWPLTRGFRVVVHGEQAVSKPVRPDTRGPIEFSLFYFASDERESTHDKYRLLLEGARFADEHGFTAVWTPERHFHPFGGLFPNPSVISAAIAATTRNVRIRAGSVVLPLHSPIRVAEEWSIVDNLSGGRVDISFASGWHPNDFVLAPERYADARRAMLDQIETFKRLWRGEAVSFRNGLGHDVAIRALPRPLQRDVSIWLTAAGNPETFRVAGELGANVLTHLLGQNLGELAKKIQIYRDAWKASGHGPKEGHVTLMLHTFVGEDVDSVHQKVREPLRQYLKSSVGLMQAVIGPLLQGAEIDALREADLEILLSRAIDRYLDQMGLFGTKESCLLRIDRLRGMGVDEIACLIDFGVDFESTMEGLQRLTELRKQYAECDGSEDIPASIARHRVSHFQCTPSMLRMLLLEPGGGEALSALDKLLVGGEAFPVALGQEVRPLVKGEVLNMYGPTETTIWSSFHRLEHGEAKLPIGRPLSNTSMYLVDRRLWPVPVGVPGELLIGGDGVARGYLHRPGLTAERFIPDPFGPEPGARLYRTGDLAHRLPDGSIEFLGRLDQQVKVRGVRIEPGEIEAALRLHPEIQQAAVVARTDAAGEVSLVAYLVAGPDANVAPSDLRRFLKDKLPASMIPALFVRLGALPLTPNKKVDLRALPAPDEPPPELSAAYVAPRDALELELVALWEELFDMRPIGITSSFFQLGGHSLLAVRLISRLRAEFGSHLPVSLLFQADTIQQMAPLLRQRVGSISQSPLVRIQATGKSPPLFFVHPTGGDVLCYAALARHLGPQQPFYALQSPMDQEVGSIEEIAARYLNEARKGRATGPYRLGGWSTGGIIALAMARQLAEAGEQVEVLMLLETWSPEIYRRADEPGALMAWFATDMIGGMGAADLEAAQIEALDEAAQLGYVVERAKAAGVLRDVDPSEIEQRFRIFAKNARALSRYRPEPYRGRVLFLQAEEATAHPRDGIPDPRASWGHHLDQVALYRVPGTHYTMLQVPHVRAVADRLTWYLDQLNTPATLGPQFLSG